MSWIATVKTLKTVPNSDCAARALFRVITPFENAYGKEDKAIVSANQAYAGHTARCSLKPSSLLPATPANTGRQL